MNSPAPSYPHDQFSSSPPFIPDSLPFPIVSRKTLTSASRAAGSFPSLFGLPRTPSLIRDALSSKPNSLGESPALREVQPPFSGWRRFFFFLRVCFTPSYTRIVFASYNGRDSLNKKQTKKAMPTVRATIIGVWDRSLQTRYNCAADFVTLSPSQTARFSPRFVDQPLGLRKFSRLPSRDAERGRGRKCIKARTGCRAIANAWLCGAPS